MTYSFTGPVSMTTISYAIRLLNTHFCKQWGAYEPVFSMSKQATFLGQQSKVTGLGILVCAGLHTEFFHGKEELTCPNNAIH